MKKGIILEQHRKYTILLTKDGSFEKGIVIQETADVGEEVFFKPYKESFLFMKKDRNLSFKILSVACIFMLCFITFYFSSSEHTYAYVTVDINPSIELEIDEDYIVQSIRPVNKDAALVTDELNHVKNKTLEVVIQMIIHKSEEMSLVNDDKNILVGISFNDEAPNKQKVIHDMERQLGMLGMDWNFAMFHVPEDIRILADETETSMNKILAHEYFVNKSLEEDIHTEFIMDEEEVELISTFYDPADDGNIDNKKIEVMSEPIEVLNDEIDTENDSTEINSSLKQSDDIGNNPNLEDETQVQEEEEITQHSPINTDVQLNNVDEQDEIEQATDSVDSNEVSEIME